MALCLVVLVSTSVIPSSAEGEYCPNGHIGGLQTGAHWGYEGPNDDYCWDYYLEWGWTCCDATEKEILEFEAHDYWMTGASYMTCTKCGYGRHAK